MESVPEVQPVLPWANTNPVKDEEVVLPVGTRIEVRWCLDVDEEEAEEPAAPTQPDTPSDQPNATAATDSPQPGRGAAATNLGSQVDATASTNPTSTSAMDTTASNPQTSTPDESKSAPEATKTKRTVMWWGAVVDSIECNEQGLPTSEVLRYDAKEGFDEEIRKVEVYSNGYLYDQQEDALMRWKREGDPEPPLSDDDEEEEAAEHAEGGAAQVATVGKVMGACLGRLLEKFGEDKVNSLDAFTQHKLVESWGALVERVSEMANSKAPGEEVSVDDVQEVFRQLKRQRQ